MSIAGKIAAAAGLVMLAGCTTGDYSRPTPVSLPPQAGVDGSWVDQAGTGVTTFSAGRFETFAADTLQKLSEGSYTSRPDGIVEINGFSLIQQKPIAFNCGVASPTQLNCTSSTGQQFVLMRRTGV